MNPKIIIDGNAIYELDEACLVRKKQAAKKKGTEKEASKDAEEKLKQKSKKKGCI